MSIPILNLIALCLVYLLIRSLGWIMQSSHNIIVSVDKQFLLIMQDNFASTIFGKEDSVTNTDQWFANVSVI